MFTGIIEEVGTVERIVGGPQGGKVITIRSGFDPSSVRIGDSIACGGVCLTVTRLEGPRFTVDAEAKTLTSTTVGEMRNGSRVNLERAMAIGDRIGGHLVQGHVDGVGVLRSVNAHDNAYDLAIEMPEDLAELIAPRGSVAIDGISLTVTFADARAFGVSIIPHTWKVTTIGNLTAGRRLNLEVDPIARYLARMLDARGLAGTKTSGMTEDFLRRHGY